MILSSTKEYENKRNGDSVRLKRRPLAIGRREGGEARSCSLEGRQGKREKRGKKSISERQREGEGDPPGRRGRRRETERIRRQRETRTDGDGTHRSDGIIN